MSAMVAVNALVAHQDAEGLILKFEADAAFIDFACMEVYIKGVETQLVGLG